MASGNSGTQNKIHRTYLFLAERVLLNGINSYHFEEAVKKANTHTYAEWDRERERAGGRERTREINTGERKESFLLLCLF